MAVDDAAARHPMVAGRLGRLSARVGRSPEIEEAKTIIADRCGITRGAAFDLLRHTSTRTNRKLRDVAADLIRRDDA